MATEKQELALKRLRGDNTTVVDPPQDPPPPVDPVDPPADPPTPPIVNEVKELDDNALLEALQKRGFTASSLDDLKPKEIIDPVVLAEQREANKLSFALQNGIVKRKEYEGFIAESSDRNNVAFRLFAADAKLDNPEATEEEIKTDFIAEFGLDAGENSAKYKRGQQKIALLTDKALQDKYPGIYKLDNEFSRYETEQLSQKQQEQKILAQTPVFRNDIKEIVSGLQKVSFQNGQETNEIEIPAEALKAIEDTYLTPEVATAMINNGWNKEKLASILKGQVISQNLPYIIAESNKKYLEKHQAGTRGIPPKEPLQKVKEATTLTDKQQQALNRYFPDKQPIAN